MKGIGQKKTRSLKKFTIRMPADTAFLGALGMALWIGILVLGYKTGGGSGTESGSILIWAFTALWCGMCLLAMLMTLPKVWDIVVENDDITVIKALIFQIHWRFSDIAYAETTRKGIKVYVEGRKESAFFIYRRCNHCDNFVKRMEKEGKEIRDLQAEEEKKRDPYGYTLSRLFWSSGFASLLTFTSLGAVCFLFLSFGYSLGGRIYILLVFFMIGALFGYLPAISGLLRVLEQEKATGLKWKDHTDFEKEEWKRDWYVAMRFGGFYAYHRDYIRKIVGTERRVETEQRYRSLTLYVLTFEDIRGKQHRLRFYEKSQEKKFWDWWKGAGK